MFIGPAVFEKRDGKRILVGVASHIEIQLNVSNILHKENRAMRKIDE